MKKLAVFLSSLLVIGTLTAKENGSKKSIFDQRLVETTFSTGFTKANINKITGTKIKSNPIVWGAIRLALFPDSYNVSLGYSKTFQNEDYTENAKIDNSAEQVTLSVPFKSVGLTGFEFLYKKYKFNSSLEVKKDNIIGFVLPNNRDKDRKILLDNSSSVLKARAGRTLPIYIELEKFELRRYLKDKVKNGDMNFFVSLFQEQLTKPWEDKRLNEIYDYPERVTIVYGKTLFTSQGIAFGGNVERHKLNRGFSLKNFTIDMSRMDIDLTDNYSLEEKISNNLKGYKVSAFLEAGYRFPTPFIKTKSYMLLSVFGKYDYFYLSNSGIFGKIDEADLSSDYFYGAEISLTF